MLLGKTASLVQVRNDAGGSSGGEAGEEEEIASHITSKPELVRLGH